MGTVQKLQRALIPQTSNWSGTIFCRFLQQTGSIMHACERYIKGELISFVTC